MADILLVDDDPHLREVVRYALAREGHALREAGDGEEALRAFEVAPPDLLVLDVLMPELDGLEVCRRIRKVSSVPILFLSSRSEEMDRVMGLDLVRVNMHKVFIALIFTTVAFFVFASKVEIAWEAGAALAVGTGIGGWMGAHATIRKGEKFIKRALIAVLAAMTAKLLFFP